jgi:hypothetical protein
MIQATGGLRVARRQLLTFGRFKSNLPDNIAACSMDET